MLFTRIFIRVTLFALLLLTLSMVGNRLFLGAGLTSEILVLISGFYVAVLTSLIIFNAGQIKPADSQPLFTFAAIGLKFIFSAIIALIYFELLEFSSPGAIILFFVLYLTFTIYLLGVVLNRLKNKKLNTDQV